MDAPVFGFKNMVSTFDRLLLGNVHKSPESHDGSIFSRMVPRVSSPQNVWIFESPHIPSNAISGRRTARPTIFPPRVDNGCCDSFFCKYSQTLSAICQHSNPQGPSCIPFFFRRSFVPRRLIQRLYSSRVVTVSISSCVGFFIIESICRPLSTVQQEGPIRLSLLYFRPSLINSYTSWLQVFPRQPSSRRPLRTRSIPRWFVFLESLIISKALRRRLLPCLDGRPIKLPQLKKSLSSQVI